MNVVLECGFVAWPILLVVGFAVPLSVVALALSINRKRAAAVFAALTLSTAFLPFTLGVFGESLGRSRVQDMLAGGAIAPEEEELIRQAGYAEAAQCKKLGLGGTVPPALVALVALGLTFLLKPPAGGSARPTPP